jgi:FKBP-type peptidyl-prolyl cis-trans isomerase SlyD
MQIAKNSVVGFDYTLKDDDGKVIDSSEGHEPLLYLHGAEGIIPGLERELEGKKVGDELKVSVSPADGYGERSDELEQEVPRENFAGIDDLELGMQLQTDSETGPTVVTVVAIADDVVTIDGNHPLAGVNLHFEVAIREIREATEDEISHGHIHGPGGHEH